jgi:hypothetical protein
MIPAGLVLEEEQLLLTTPLFSSDASLNVYY